MAATTYGLEKLLILAQRDRDELLEDLADIERARAAAGRSLEALQAEAGGEGDMSSARRANARTLFVTLDAAAETARQRLERVEREFNKLTRLIAAMPASGDGGISKGVSGGVSGSGDAHAIAG